MSDRPCTKDAPGFTYLCSCDKCCREAAHAWTAYFESDDFEVGVVPAEFRREFDTP